MLRGPRLGRQRGNQCGSATRLRGRGDTLGRTELCLNSRQARPPGWVCRERGRGSGPSLGDRWSGRTHTRASRARIQSLAPTHCLSWALCVTSVLTAWADMASRHTWPLSPKKASLVARRRASHTRRSRATPIACVWGLVPAGTLQHARMACSGRVYCLPSTPFLSFLVPHKRKGGTPCWKRALFSLPFVLFLPFLEAPLLEEGSNGAFVSCSPCPLPTPVLSLSVGLFVPLSLSVSVSL